MKLRSTFALGRLRVRRSGYGAMQLAGPWAVNPPADQASAIDLLRAAITAGIDHIDTAQYYGPDLVNELIREALHPYPPGLAIVSKVAVGSDAAGSSSRTTTHASCVRASKPTSAACGSASWRRSTSVCPATAASTRASTISWPPWSGPATRA